MIRLAIPNLMLTTRVSKPDLRAPAATLASGRRVVSVVAGGVLVIVVGAVLGLGIGTMPIAPADVVRAVLHPTGDATSIIVWQLRMPRTVLALLVGAALAVAGTTMQALTRNPLAEPGLLGVNAGAALAVVLATTLLGVGTAGSLPFALGGAAIAAVAVVTAASGPRQGPARLVLAGAAFAACASAITGVITMRNPGTFSDYRAWVVGSFAERDHGVLVAVAPLIITGLVVSVIAAHALNALALGEDQAHSLGVRMGAARVAAIVAVVLLSGGATAAAGPISFVGLLVPHTLRLLHVVDVRTQTLLACIIGPALLLIADVIGRIVIAPDELQVGIVVALIGAPGLVWLILRWPARAERRR